MSKENWKDHWRFTQYDAFLSPQVADEASQYCDKLISSTEHVWTTNFAWASNKQSGGGLMEPKNERYENLCLVHKVHRSNPSLYDKIVRDLQVHLPDLEPETPDSLQYFVWTGGSRIEWHRDFKGHVSEHGRYGAVTIYLNRHWDIEWGGDFLYKDLEDKVHRVTPSYNRAVSIGAVFHRSTEIQSKRFRKCLQIFLRKRQQPIDFNEDFC